VTEVGIPSGSAFAGIAAADFPARIHGVRRGGRRRFFQRKGTRLAAGDILLMETDMPRLEGWLADGTLALPASAGGERVETVLMPESMLAGSRVGALEGFSARGVWVVAVAAQSPRLEGGFDDLQLRIGDILYLEGEHEAIADAIEEAELLPLWPRPAKPAIARPWVPVLVFGAGVVLAVAGLAPPEFAFGLVVLVLAATGVLNLRQGLAALDWPILIMLAAMIPLGVAVETTGAGAVLASRLVAMLPVGEPLTLVAAVLALAVVITPFVNNASTAIVLGPVAIGIADSAGLPAEPFLIAVALGASIDFLTPIGHHNNTIVMGLAGYRFSDFLKAGWPLTLTAIVVGVVAIGLVWV
jgi:di/tricarboxylate transporter